MNRTAQLNRSTAETTVDLKVDLDGLGRANIDTGVGFFDHLLTSFATHGLFDLDVKTVGDLHIDDHHTVEDTALVLGSAFSNALGDRAGISRFGDARVPMDEALAEATIDVSGRPYAVIELALDAPALGNLSTQNIPHALEAFARTAGLTLHLRSQGRNDHHVAEAAIKALARALRAAVQIDPRRGESIPSSKGAL
ncbi:MAG TPA: imidazoleglycerol-phosphate dehydratase HisB [Acidimicrobiia bacterium]|nr:imidazoleglycerol-phosphate dehydratase HisB [Acidimicrobiia bacterium]